MNEVLLMVVLVVGVPLIVHCVGEVAKLTYLLNVNGHPQWQDALDEQGKALNDPSLFWTIRDEETMYWQENCMRRGDTPWYMQSAWKNYPLEKEDA